MMAIYSMDKLYNMNKKSIILILLVAIVVIGVVCLHVYDNNKPKEAESTSYDINEELVSVEITYGGRPKYWDVLTIDFVKRTLTYMKLGSSKEDEKVYELRNANIIYNYFKEKILYGNWNGDMITPPCYVTVNPPGEEAGSILWSIHVGTNDAKYMYGFSDCENLPSFWYELIELICEGTGAKSEDFGILIEEETEEVEYEENDKIYGVEIYYRDTPVTKEAKLDIDFESDKIYYYNLHTGGKMTYECSDMDKVIGYFEENVFYDKWNGKTKEAPFTLGIDYDEFGRYVPAWKVTIKTSKGDVELWEKRKYPSFWYDMFDVITESIDVDYEEIGMSD